MIDLTIVTFRLAHVASDSSADSPRCNAPLSSAPAASVVTSTRNTRRIAEINIQCSSQGSAAGARLLTECTLMGATEIEDVTRTLLKIPVSVEASPQMGVKAYQFRKKMYVLLRPMKRILVYIGLKNTFKIFEIGITLPLFQGKALPNRGFTLQYSRFYSSSLA